MQFIKEWNRYKSVIFFHMREELKPLQRMVDNILTKYTVSPLNDLHFIEKGEMEETRKRIEKAQKWRQKCIGSQERNKND